MYSRRPEAAALAEALETEPPSVVAAAGGTVLDEVNRARMHEHGTVVWLRADASELAQRVRNGSHRPLLADDPEATLRTLADQRRDLYTAVADHILDTTGRSPEEIVDELCAIAQASREVPR